MPRYWSAGTPADFQAEATSYFAYCGPDLLRLSTVDPYVSGGKKVHACMAWKRAKAS